MTPRDKRTLITQANKQSLTAVLSEGCADGEGVELGRVIGRSLSVIEGNKTRASARQRAGRDLSPRDISKGMFSASAKLFNEFVCTYVCA